MAHSTSAMALLVPSTNTKHNRRMLREEIQDIFDPSIKRCFPELNDDEVFCCSPLKGSGQEKYGDQKKYGDKKKDGDYISINVLSICERLRSTDPNLFHRKRPRDIAQELLEAVKEIQKQKHVMMIDNLRIRDVGYITFKISSEWMVERIKNVLTDGIDTWAPINLKRAVVDYPTLSIGADFHADVIRSRYIHDMLFNMLTYSGVAVGARYFSARSDAVVRTCFLEDKGVIRSRRNRTPLFVVMGEALQTPLNNVHKDLSALWSAINMQRAELIIYVTPVRQREHVEKCFAAAKNENWLSREWNPTVLYCGYRTSSSEQEKLASLWNKYESHSKAAFLIKLGKDAGYSAEASFECAVKYSYLKSHRLAFCSFNIDEILDEEGNTFVYLLRTQAILPSHRENFGSGGMVVNYKKEFFARERELQLHLVQFTEVIDWACLTFLLHPVCEYLWSLCKKFTSYCDEVLQQLDLKTFRSKLFLYDASRVVMRKCFHLLGFNPGFFKSSSRVIFSRMERAIRKETPFEDHFIPFPVSDARDKYLNPRFELFGMIVNVSHFDFKKGDVFGNVSLKDKDGLLSDGRLPLDENENGHVSYFHHDWDDSIGISNNSHLLFGNPTPSCSVPFSSVIEINVLLYAITAEKDKSFLICNCTQPIPLLKFWDDGLDFMRSTLSFKSKDGCIEIDYIMLRDAVDTAMKLSFQSPKDPDKRSYVTGHIFAYYGDGVLDDCDDDTRRRFKAILFQEDNDFELTVGPLELKKSVLAIPANGCLKVEAIIFDVKAEKYVLNDTYELRPQPNDHSECRMSWENGCFNLTVEWSKGPKTSYT